MTSNIPFRTLTDFLNGRLDTMDDATFSSSWSCSKHGCQGFDESTPKIILCISRFGVPGGNDLPHMYVADTILRSMSGGSIMSLVHGRTSSTPFIHLKTYLNWSWEYQIILLPGHSSSLYFKTGVERMSPIPPGFTIPIAAILM